MAKHELDIMLTPSQRKVDLGAERFQILLAGRKFGKTTYGLYRLIRSAGKSGVVVWYVAPTYRQAKLIAWRDLKRMLPSAVTERANENELTIELRNGSVIYLMGSDSPDSLRGPSPSFVVLDEAAMHTPEVWPEVIRPALTAKKGSALFITTPKGMNWLHDLWQETKGNPEWGHYHFSIYDNPHISPDEIEAAKKECRSPVVWRQEYLAQFEAHLGRVIPSLSEKDHFIPLPPYRNESVYVSIDFGQRDETAAVFFVIRDGVFQVLDYYAQSGLGARQQAQMIKRHINEKGYRVDHAVLSHDAFRQDADRKGETIAWRFVDEFHPIPVERSDKLRKARTDLLISMFDQKKVLIHRSDACYKLFDQLNKLEWKDTLAEEMKGNDDGFDALGYGAMNMAHVIGIEKREPDLEEDRPSGLRLRGFEETFGNAVFDEVTGYVGNSVF